MNNTKSIVVVLALMLMLTSVAMAGTPRMSTGILVSADAPLLSKPTITMNNATDIVERFNASYDAGATASDEDGVVSVDITGSINVNVPGSYTLTYEATNSAGTTAVTRTIVVEDTTAPAEVKNLVASSVTSHSIGLTWSNEDATISPDFTNVVISVYLHGETTAIAGYDHKELGKVESTTIDGLIPGTSYDILVQTADDGL